MIDEYDAVANEAYLEFERKDADKVAKLFKLVYGDALKGNPHLRKGVITGIQYLAKSGILSDLNNLKTHNIDSFKYSKYYGVYQEEMDLLNKLFGVNEEEAREIKKWYNGYKAKDDSNGVINLREYYNIWSVFNYLSEEPKIFRSFWVESGFVDVVSKTLLKNDKIREKIKALVSNNDGILISSLTVDFSINDWRTLK